MKHMKYLLLIPLLLISVVLTGCTTMADAVAARGTGETVAYQASFDEIWAELPGAITAAGLQFVSANREDRSMLAQRGITAFSYGENVAIFVEKIQAKQSSVEVVSKKSMQTNIFAPNWAKPIFEQLDKKFKRS